MSDDRHLLRRIAWDEVCPWLMLVRCYWLAISPGVLFLATIGLLILPLGDLATQLFVEPEATMPSAVDVPNAENAHSVFRVTKYDLCPYPWGGLGENIVQVVLSFSQPVARLFDRSLSTSAFFLQAFVFLWRIAVWSLFGGAITRIAAVYLGRDERVSMFDALQHSARNFGWYFGSPLFPLLGVALLLVPLAVLGLLMKFDMGALFAALVWPIALLFALGMAVLVFAVLLGWPLMWPTLSTEEGGDSFEAFSRSFSFTFQRPVHYLFYAVVTVLLGGLGWLLVSNLGNAVIVMSEWATSWGAGNDRLDEVLSSAPERGWLLSASSSLIHGWNWIVRTIVVAFSYGFFFSSASAIYLLLRHDVDQTDFDEVFLPDEMGRFGLSAKQLNTDGEPPAP